MATDGLIGMNSIDEVMTIQVADHRLMPFEPQGRPQCRDHRKARFILTQQDEFPGLGFFLMPGGPAGPSPAGPGRL